jgi:type II secretory pathway predicted ATPase ExeA
MEFDRLFGPILKALNEGLVITQRTISDKETTKVGVNAQVLQAGGELSTEYSDSYMPVVPEVIDFDFVATALKKHAEQLDTIVIEEFQRLSTTTQRDVVQLMKVLCDQAIPARIIIIGITEVGGQLTEDREYQEYIGRCIITVAMPRMTPEELRDIIDRRAVSGIRVAEDVAGDLVWVASGYPALVHRVMFDAVLRWIVANVAALVLSVIDLASRVVGFFSAGAGKTIAVKRIELDKAGVNVARKELEDALRQYVASFESEELRGSSYERTVINEQAKAALDAYALADGDELEAQAAGALLPKDLRPPAGLRPYLRAKLLLAGDTRAGARGSASDETAQDPIESST